MILASAAKASQADSKKQAKYKKLILEFIKAYDNKESISGYTEYCLTSTTAKANVEGRFNYFMESLK